MISLSSFSEPLNFSKCSNLAQAVCQVYISQLSISDMNRISLQLLTHATLAIAIPAIENDLVSQYLLGPEAGITDFAVLTDNNLDDNLPPNITICSSVASAAFLGSLAPFQLLYPNGDAWISIHFYSAYKESTRHKLNVYVSAWLHLCYLKMFVFRWMRVPLLL